ncbi:MAG: SBBP repeat-containing protein [Verrucomicrobia bacterium]|nr:SBBP repeat-containing protein [Verrucomicrobiota bacterium]
MKKHITPHRIIPWVLSVCAWLMSTPPARAAGMPPQAGHQQASLLQYQSGGHLLGFSQGKMVVVASGGTALTEEFVGASGVMPTATANGGETAASGEVKRGGKAAPFAGVTYQGLWHGVNLSYRPTGDGFAESVYEISAGADVSRIKLRYNVPVEVQKEGCLKFTPPANNGYFLQSPPVAWQVIDGANKPITVAFRQHADGTIGFSAGAYNRNYPLTIDPSYSWHTFYGTSGEDRGQSIAIDSSGNVYITGFSDATWNGPAGQAPLHAHSGGSDILVMKLDSAGAYQWHTFYGSTQDEYSYGVAVDSSGNAYVTGESSASWNGPTGQVPMQAYSAKTDVFVLKLSSAGAYQWHTFHGGNAYDSGYGLALDSSGNVYVTGHSNFSWNGSAGQAPLNAFNPVNGNGNYNILVLKLSSAGAYQWHTFYGSIGNDDGYGLALDSSGNVYVTGSSAATWDGPTGQAPLHAHSGNNDITILKLNSAGAYQWHTFYGSNGDDDGQGLALDSGGNVYVTGNSNATWNGPTGQAPLLALHNINDIFVLKLNAAGAYQWHTFYGSTGGDSGWSIAVDSSSNVYITGSTALGWPFADGNGNGLHEYMGGISIFILKLNSAGAHQWHTFYNEGNSSYGQGIAVDSGGHLVYATGMSNARWAGDDNKRELHSFSGSKDIFVLKIADKQTLTVAKTGAGSGTITSSPAGINYGATASCTFDYNTVVTLTPTPGAGSVFAGWSGDGTDGVVTMDADKSCTATFRPPTVMTAPGNTLTFNGTTQYVNIPDANSLDLTTNYTLETWFKANSFGSGGGAANLRGLIGKYQTASANGYLLRTNLTELDFDQLVTSGLNLQAGQWYHVAAVNSNGTRHLYVNGVEKTITGTATVVVANTNEVRLGSDYRGRYFAGQLDEVRIWNTARSQTDIQDSMHHVLTGSESGLAAYYQFDESSGTLLPDLTANSNLGTLVNAPTWTTGTTPLANVIASKTNIRGAWIANTNTLASSRLSVASASVTGSNLAVFGHDNGTDAWQITDVPGTVNSRLTRVWRAEVNGSATGTIKIDTTGLSDFGDGSTLRLLVDADGTFASGATTLAGSYSAPYFTVSGQAIANGSYYALGSNRSFYSVTYAANGANSGTAPDAQTKTQGIGLTLASNTGSLARTNYTIAGWNTAADGSGTSYGLGATYSTDAALALYAKWSALPSNSTAIAVYGQSGSFTTGDANQGGVGISAVNLNGPAGVVVDTTSNVYVADSLNNRVLYYPAGSTTATRVYGQNGDFTTSDANKGGISANSLNQPQAVALDSSSNLYVADSGNNRVLYYTAGSTTATRVYGQDNFTSNAANKGGGISAVSLNAPAGLVLDGSNNLYVTDMQNNRVLYFPAGTTTATRVYGQGGSFTTGDANQGGISANSLKTPFGIALNASGGLVVADVSNNRVLGYPAGGTTATVVYGQGGVFTTNTNNKGGISADSLSLPLAVVVDGSGNLWVADMNNNRVLYYSSGSTTATRVYGQGCVFTTGTANKGGLSANSLKAPAGLALDSAGNLYVSDQQNNRVLKYDHTLPQAYAVTYNGNGSDGGSTPVDSGSPYLSGTTVIVLSNTFTKSGYNFAGWYPAADGSGTVYGASFVMGSANTTLYAKWTVVLPTYAVTYNANGATSGTAPSTQTKTQGTGLTLATNTGSLAKTGSPFAGWNTAADGTGTNYAPGATYSTDAALTLYAKWRYAITASAGANGALDATTPSPQSVSYNATTSFKFSANAGYYVASVSGCGINYINTDDSVTTYTATTGAVTADGTVAATFALNNCISGNGVTIITHGWNPVSSAPTWLASMRDDIAAGYLGNERNYATITVTKPAGSLVVTTSPWDFDLSAGVTGQILVVLDWSAVANHLTSGVTAQAVAAAVVDKIVTDQNGKQPLAELPIHLIGHSRGGGMVLELARLLGERGVVVDQVTPLDPHPLTASDPQPLFPLPAIIDTPAAIYQNVVFSDVYYQNNETPTGQYVTGAYNRQWGNMAGGYHDNPTPVYANHRNIYLMYQGTQKLANPVSNGEASMDATERTAWFNSYENSGANTGIYYSRLNGTGNRGGSNQPVASGDAVKAGLHNHALFGGTGSRQTLTWASAAWPNIAAFDILSAGTPLSQGNQSVTIGTTLNLRYVYLDYASGCTVTLHADVDRNPYNNNDLALIRTVSHSAATGATYTGNTVAWDTSGLSPGDNMYLYAKITDGTKTRYFYAPSRLVFASAATYTVTATADAHGTIAPAGAVAVPSGGTQNFHLTPATYYHVADVTKNGVSVGAVTDYSWTNVTADGTIHAEFAPDLAASGTPHWWLAQHGWTNNFDAAEAADTDGDGQSAGQEYLADTNPTATSSVFRVTGFVSSPTVAVTCASSASRLYTLYRNTDLAAGAWLPVSGQTDVAGTGSPLTLHDTTTPQPHCFYRIGVRLPSP